MKKILLLLTAALLCVGNTWAEIAWSPETVSAGTAFYIQHKTTGLWLNANNNTLQSSPNATWTPSSADNGGFTFASSKVNGKDYRWRIYNLAGDRCTTTDTGSATKNLCAVQPDGSYDVYVTRSSGGTWYLHATINNSNVLSVTSEKSNNNPKDYWYFYGVPQYNNHLALVAYEVANDALASYNASNLPNALWNQIKDAVNPATSYLSYTDWVKTTDKSTNIASATSTLTTFNTTYGSTLAATSSAYTSALANEFAEVVSALGSAEEGAAKNALQDAYDTALTDIEAAESANAIADVVSTLSSALSTYYLTNKPQPSFNKNYADAAASLLVDGTIENAFIIQNAPSYTISYKDNDALVASATSSVITFSAGTITAIGAGSVTLVLDQAETNAVKAGHAEFNFTVSKHNVVWTWNAGNAAYVYNTTINNILTLTEGNPLNITITSDNEAVAKVENGNLVMGKVAGTAHITVSAATDYKWNAKQEIFNVTPGYAANHVPFDYGQTLYEDINVTTKDANLDQADNYTNFKISGTKKTEHYLQIAIAGVPDKLSFHYKPVNNQGINNWDGNDYYVRESSDGLTWSENIWTANGGTNSQYVDDEVDLAETTRFVRLIYKGHENGGYFGNIHISERKSLAAETPAVILTKLGDTESANTNVILAHSNAGLTINASITGEGFSIDHAEATTEGGIDVYAEETFVVSFDPTDKAAGEYSATVSFTDGDLQKDVTVTAYVQTPASLSVKTAVTYGTFVAPFDVELPAGITAYNATKGAGDWIVLDAMSLINNILTAGTPAILENTTGADIAETFYGLATVNETVSANGIIKGVYATTKAPVGSYVLQKHDEEFGFYLVEESVRPNVGANRCYLELSAGAPERLSIVLGGNPVATGMQNIFVKEETKKAMLNGQIVIFRDGKMYNVNGMLVK